MRDEATDTGGARLSRSCSFALGRAGVRSALVRDTIPAWARRARVAFSGHAYVDSNAGQRPLERDFRSWDWSRFETGGDTHVRYAARCVDGEETTAFVQAPYTKTPKRSTGAGDNFNAGCCIAALADLPLDQMLAAGNAASGYYVRNAASPTLDDLIDFVETMPEPED